MPWTTEWVDPETFLTHKGVTVYHTYDGDDFAQGRRTFWFTLHPNCGEEECNCAGATSECRNVFDVRELLAWSRRANARAEDLRIRAAIISSIDMGLLPPLRRKAPQN